MTELNQVLIGDNEVKEHIKITIKIIEMMRIINRILFLIIPGILAAIQKNHRTLVSVISIIFP